MSSDDFYLAFENQYRGSRELVKSRLEFYLPPLQKLVELYPDDPTVLDLGCGRGEWLELASEAGAIAIGVDISEHMLNECESRDLVVFNEDALQYLRSVPDNSLCAISAFHFIEHVPFDTLRSIVDESIRVLKPAGLLILETPNPENIVVGTSAFYFDPTHTKPIPPELLSFVVNYGGFTRTGIFRLQENPDLLNKEICELLDVLAGVSPDYGLIAQKASGDSEMNQFDHFFSRTQGLTLPALAKHYDKSIARQLDQLRQEFEPIKVELNELEAVNENLKSELERKNEELHAVNQYNHYHFQLSEARSAELTAVYNSLSWRLTAPLRSIVQPAQERKEKSVKPQAQLSERLIIWAMGQPKLVEKVHAVVDRVPPLRRFITRRVASTLGESPAYVSQSEVDKELLSEALMKQVAQSMERSRNNNMEIIQLRRQA